MVTLLLLRVDYAAPHLLERRDTGSQLRPPRPLRLAACAAAPHRTSGRTRARQRDNRAPGRSRRWALPSGTAGGSATAPCVTAYCRTPPKIGKGSGRGGVWQGV